MDEAHQMKPTPIRITAAEMDAFNKDWAKVELYRWQHGNLPGEPGTEVRELDEAAGLRAMADALEKGCKTNDMSVMPSPFNVISVLRYVAGLLDKSNAASEGRRSEA
jgi:hypothetical protein